MTRLLTSLGLLLALALPAHAETVDLDFDPDHTHIMFTVMHLGLARTYGEFERFDGRMVLDTNRPQNVVLELTIEVASLDSGLAARDENLMGGSWFDADDHPTMTFVATDFEATDDTTGTLTGDFTLLGVTRPVALNVVFNGKASDPFSPRKTRWGFSATGAIKRSDFGMDFGTGFVADDVALIIETELLQISD
ncbi:YceI family protein [Pyruvatibacter sp.]|uniref:YceI family protein n=1 Tax=Pyruvatibacter sp. TaxID=1981328 RepID=UPI0032EAAAD1